MSLITANENVDKFYLSNKILIDQLLKKFTNIYILNLYNLKIFTKKESIKCNTNLPKEIKIINFKNSDELKKFSTQYKIISISFIGKNLTDFKIQYFLKKINIKLIMIMYFSQIGNKMTIDVSIKNAVVARKHYFNKGFYHLFRILTILNIFPKIDLLFESNLEIINFIKNSRSKKIEKYLPFLKISYFKEVLPVNSIYFDSINILKQKKMPENKHIVYIDTHFDHADRTSREGEVNQINQEIFYNYLKIFLQKISKIYQKPIIIAKHPANKSNNKFYDFFEISKIPTNEAIFDSELTVFTVSSAILNAVFLKKKIINISSMLLGGYLQNMNRQYVKSLGLVSFDIDKDISLEKKLLDSELKKSVENYDQYINNKLILDGNNSPSKKISDIINERFF
tara:strand:- start:141 stop:1331 length:1191 start_codon:yes stop_codon:yes gene_type:complete